MPRTLTSSVPARVAGTPSAGIALPGADSGSGGRQAARRAAAGWVALLVATAVVLRLPLLDQPLSRDEAGYLMVASQLGPGRSLYGDYWVDRPPLLLAFFAVADRLGGADGLRSLGLVVVAVAVVAAAALGWAVAAGRLRTRTSVACAATATVFLSTPAFGTAEVNGELVAAPLVLAGTALVLGAARAGPGGTRDGLLVLAGVAGAAAVLVKQNQWDVVVVLLALLVAGRQVRSPHRLDRRALLPVLGGAGLTTGVVLLGAAGLGTAPGGLWDAVVVFRAEAAAVVASSASPATDQRLYDLGWSFLRSGAPLLLVLLVLVLRRPPARDVVDLRLPALAVLGWETVAVLGGASYWPPYLICTVTGLVLATAVVQTREPPAPAVRRLLLVPLSAAAVSCLVSLAWAVTHPPARPQDELVGWLRAHAAPGDDAVVAYGNPDILHGAGLHSPYPHLWSLPVRVRDPALEDLARLLGGPAAPDWVVLTAPTLATWGIDARAGTRALHESYTRETVVGRYAVYRLRDDRGPTGGAAEPAG